MRLGINTVLWFWPFDTSKIEALEKIKDIGFEAVEFALVDRSPENIIWKDKYVKTQDSHRTDMAGTEYFFTCKN